MRKITTALVILAIGLTSGMAVSNATKVYEDGSYETILEDGTTITGCLIGNLCDDRLNER